ncbi:HPC2-domain-containing protein, partial [Mytilinidion resinicola]
EPKDPAAPPVPRKKRQKVEPPQHEEKPLQPHPPATRQPKLTELVSVIQPDRPSPTPTPAPVQAPRLSGNPEAFQNPNVSHLNVAPSTPRPASSGQVYDPIRGGFESKPPASTSSAPPLSPPLNRASASPSITSLIDPPSSSFNQASRFQHPSVTSAPASPAPLAARPPQLASSAEQHLVPRPTNMIGSTPMDLDPTDSHLQRSVPMKKSDSSAGTTPPVKPARQKEQPPPLPTGSGLLSGTPFGPTPANGAPAGTHGTNIWLTFPLKGQTHTTINFAREVEKKYGFAALHPRIAARRERQRQIRAAGAALEKADGTGSADDMSLDLSEDEVGSNVEMGGMDGDENNSNTNGDGKKKRRRKVEDYDKEDDFIDDTELAWEQQALMAKDGFFVYSGPLVTEGERQVVERADGTVKRGRGRGRGGSTRGETSGRGRGRGGGPGSRGGTTVRKPRVTKADRAQMEIEKHNREQQAANLAGKLAPGGGMNAGAMPGGGVGVGLGGGVGVGVGAYGGSVGM